ncbi:MAG: RNA 2'-phosphotransferase [candidate division WOR-3 bacterium]|nr:MAG: RNA 2'-phosphotransferase [candidate division WOR-3 bacterium]
MDDKLVRLSKFLCLVLRHKPETIGLALDEEGWANIEELIRKSLDAGVFVDQPTLRQIVENSEKKRFSFSPNGESIKADYGHSIPISLGRETSEPPEYLYHGTARASLSSIAKKGLGPGARQYVHLVEDKETAFQVGGRHGEPVVLIVKAQAMNENGFKFHRTESGIWLTKEVPAEYIEAQGNFPASSGENAGC